jgi:hypothetical protein
MRRLQPLTQAIKQMVDNPVFLATSQRSRKLSLLMVHSFGNMAERSITWTKEGRRGTETARVRLQLGRLTAVGKATGSAPIRYSLDYELTTGAHYTTTKLVIRARGEGWSRWMHLMRSSKGIWLAPSQARGVARMKAPGGDTSLLNGAMDCDLAWSPLTNAMPVLRHDLLRGGGSVDLLMAWVSVPDLHVYPSAQRYTFLRRDGGHSVIRYESIPSGFTSDIVFDPEGLVVDYPGVGRRL